MLPISSKGKKAKLSDSDPEDSGIRTIYDKYGGEREEMFSEAEIGEILKMHRELAAGGGEQEQEPEGAWLTSPLDGFDDPLQALNDKLASISQQKASQDSALLAMQNKLEQLATAEQMLDGGVNPDYIAETYLPTDSPRAQPKQQDEEESDSEGELDMQRAMKQLGGETRLAKDLFRDLDDDATLDQRCRHLDAIFERLPQTPNYVPQVESQRFLEERKGLLSNKVHLDKYPNETWGPSPEYTDEEDQLEKEKMMELVASQDWQAYQDLSTKRDGRDDKAGGSAERRKLAEAAF